MTSHFRFGILALTWLVTSTHAVAEPRTAASGHTNRLAQEKSPYLLQHAHNPVDWYPWGEEAFAKARRENKPIFLSVGYSTCHWCHVMAHESFESEDVAAIMNREFVNIKVDREERPDIDRVYMTFVQATTGGGGWPMSVLFTPDLKPVVCGKYFPPEERIGQSRAGDGSLHAAENGGWRHARSSWRGLSSVLSRSLLARAAFRKNAVRSGATRHRLSRCLSNHARSTIRISRARHSRLRRSRYDIERGRFFFRRRCRQPRPCNGSL